MLIEISPLTYMTLCGLVSDALQYDSDATLLLQRAQRELRVATIADMIPSELVETPERLENLRKAGFVGR